MNLLVEPKSAQVEETQLWGTWGPYPEGRNRPLMCEDKYSQHTHMGPVHAPPTPGIPQEGLLPVKA